MADLQASNEYLSRIQNQNEIKDYLLTKVSLHILIFMIARSINTNNSLELIPIYRMKILN